MSGARGATLMLTALAALAALAALVGCAREPARTSAVWIVLDAAAAGHFGAYGHPAGATPHIDAFAQDAVVFDRAYAQWPSTLVSAASYLTGRYPAARRPGQRLEDPTVIGAARAAGFFTVGFSENPFISADFGFTDEFDEFHEVGPMTAELNPLHDLARRDTAKTIDRTIEWLAAHEGEDFFLYLHLIPPHAPYDAPPPFAGRFAEPSSGDLRGLMPEVTGIVQSGRELTPHERERLARLYRENLAFVDHHVGRLLDALAALDLLPGLVVIVTSDHGEAFGEHGRILHGTDLYDEQVRVPLVIRPPDALAIEPRRLAGPVQLVDLAPTLAELMGLELEPGHGQSLLPRLRGEAEGGVARMWINRRTAVVSDGHKLVVPPLGGRPSLFDLEADPGEQVDVAAERPGLVARLRRLSKPTGPARVELQPFTLTPELGEQLRALGYGE